MADTVVDVNEISRSFGAKKALDEVTFRATEGKVHGLVGSNGAGKTTLIKHLLGLLRAQSGSVRVFGRDPVRDPVGVLGRVGYLSEERELPEWMRIDELMRLHAGLPSDVGCVVCARAARDVRARSIQEDQGTLEGHARPGGPGRGRGPSSRAADSRRALLGPRRGRAPRHSRRHRSNSGRRRTHGDLLVTPARGSGADVGPRDADAPRSRDAERHTGRGAQRLPAQPRAVRRALRSTARPR